MSVSEGNTRWPGQRQPTTAEVSAFRELLGSAEAYPKSAPQGGRLRRVA